MKKILIGLFALTAVSAVANETHSFKSTESFFKPTGSLKQEIKWYGDKEEVDGEQIRFTLAEGGLRFTENFYIDYRVRDYMKYKEDDGGSNTKDLRTRLYYDHGYLGDTKIDVRQRLEVRSTQDYNRFTYTPEFDFAEYFSFADTFKLRPSLRYKDDNDANNSYKHIGADFLYYKGLTSGNHDLGIEFNIYTRITDEEYLYDNKKGTPAAEGDTPNTKDGNFSTDVEFYIYYTYDLGSYNGIDLAFYYEFGLDPYTFYNRKVDVVDGEEGSETVVDSYGSTWVVYNDFELQASYKVNEATSIYSAIAVEHANNKGQDHSSDYKWQPYAYVGWRTKF